MQGLNLAHDGLSVVVVVVVEVMFAGLVNGAAVKVVDGRTVIKIGFVVVGMVVVEAVEVGVGVVEDFIVVARAVVIVVDLNLGLNLWDLRRANGDLSVVVGVVGVVVVVVAGKFVFFIEVLHGIPCCCCCGDRGVVVIYGSVPLLLLLLLKGGTVNA